MERKRSFRWLVWVIGILLLLVIIFFAAVYSGLYNVAATYPDPAPMHWLFDTTMEHSVKRHARGIATPELTEGAKIRQGFGLYRRRCAGCHGAPGQPIGEIARAMNPAAPELADEAEEWQPNELFWITKNGIRMTGMPAWKDILSDDDIWAIVAFMQKLPEMSPDEYQRLEAENPPPVRRGGG